jgi:putative ABC transport system permease protein
MPDMSRAKQFGALLQMNLGAIPQRLGLVLTIVIGVACAVGVLVSMLAMGVGARREAMANVRADRAVLRSVDALGFTQSSIPKDAAALIHDMPGIRRNAKGEPIAVSQVFVFVRARDRQNGGQVGFPLAGVTAGLAEYMPEIHLTAGRFFKPGLRELIASNKCAQQFSDFTVGDKRSMRGGEWLVVGNFDTGNTEGVCNVFADADTILSAFGRNTYNQIGVLLRTPETFVELTSALKANPTIHAEAKHQSQVVEEDTRQFNGILNFVSYFVGSIMALAATIGAANSLYAIVDGRRRELATLRAIGFSSGPIIASLLLEAILLALPGALIGALVAWVLFNGLQASPFGTSFRLAVTPALAVLGLVWALGMGAISGLLPAVRAARVPVTVALRST